MLYTYLGPLFQREPSGCPTDVKYESHLDINITVPLYSVNSGALVYIMYSYIVCVIKSQ